MKRNVVEKIKSFGKWLYVNNPLVVRITDFIIKHKYYIVIVNVKGTDECVATSYIHLNRKSADEHRKRIERDTLSYEYIETIVFRSDVEYPAPNIPSISKIKEQMRASKNKPRIPNN